MSSWLVLLVQNGLELDDVVVLMNEQTLQFIADHLTICFEHHLLHCLLVIDVCVSQYLLLISLVLSVSFSSISVSILCCSIPHT